MYCNAFSVKYTSHTNSSHFVLHDFALKFLNFIRDCDLKVTCSPRDLRFAGSNPAEGDDFFQGVKLLSKSLPGGILSRGSRV